MGVFFWIGWFVWALLIYFLGLKHPHIYDEVKPLSPGRKLVGVLALVIFHCYCSVYYYLFIPLLAGSYLLVRFVDAFIFNFQNFLLDFGCL